MCDGLGNPLSVQQYHKEPCFSIASSGHCTLDNIVDARGVYC